MCLRHALLRSFLCLLRFPAFVDDCGNSKEEHHDNKNQKMNTIEFIWTFLTGL